MRKARERLAKKRKHVMRNATVADLPILRKLHVEQNGRDGTNYPLPRLFRGDGGFEENIALALVVEYGGEVVQGIYFESLGVEMCFAGCDPRATAYARREIDAVRYTLRALGYRWIRSMVPHQVVPMLQKPMKAAGFKRDDANLASFFLEI